MGQIEGDAEVSGVAVSAIPAAGNGGGTGADLVLIGELPAHSAKAWAAGLGRCPTSGRRCRRRRCWGHRGCPAPAPGWPGSGCGRSRSTCRRRWQSRRPGSGLPELHRPHSGLLRGRRAPAYGSGGWEFESLASWSAQLAQLGWAPTHDHPRSSPHARVGRAASRSAAALAHQVLTAGSETDERRSLAGHARDSPAGRPLDARRVGHTAADHHGVVGVVLPQPVEPARTQGQGWTVTGLAADLLWWRPDMSPPSSG
jgi:hypothetical protein